LEARLSAVAAGLAVEDSREAGIRLVLHDVAAVADGRAARVALMLIAGASKLEIRQQLGLTAKGYGEVIEQLRALFSGS
jgi:hypothetical protein